MTLPLRGTSPIPARTATDVAIARGAMRTAYLADYATALWADCATLGLRADVAFAQADLETGNRETGVGFQSRRWLEEGNPAGIGIVDGKPDSEPGRVFAAHDWARIHATHLAGYAGITPPPAWVALDFRWSAMVNAGYFGTAETVDDLAGRWASAEDYGAKIADRHARYVNPDTPEKEPVMERPYILLVAGHRSYGDGGNPNEKARTDDMALAYGQAFAAAGFEVAWFQRDLDGDSDPDDTSGDLNTVAKGCGRILAERARRFPTQLALMLDLHYNGPSSPFHVIVPDNVGLSTAYPEGRDAADTAANNTLDVELAEAIAERAVEATGLRMYNGRLGVPGVMSERETGVGLDGFRLAMFAATAPSRMTAVRLVLEHGGYNDAPAGRYGDFAAAALQAVLDVFGIVPEVPAPSYAAPAPIPELDAHTRAPDRAPFVIQLSDGTIAIAVFDRVVATVATPRRRYSLGDERVGPDIGAGTAFDVDWLLFHPERDAMYYTPFATRVRAADTSRASDIREADTA